MPGMGELLIILLIVMVIFGASKLPQIGHGLGSAIKNFKRAAAGDDEIEVGEKADKKPKQVSSGKAAKQLAAARDDDEAEDAVVDEDGDEELEEVVVRRRKKKPA